MPEWRRTRAIRVSVHTAELHIVGNESNPVLALSGSLMNIARGTCGLRISASPVAQVGALGALQIESQRPVMHAELSVAPAHFETLLSVFRLELPRPSAVVLALREELSVSLEGDLAIEDDMSCTITDVSWVLPLH